MRSWCVFTHEMDLSPLFLEEEIGDGYERGRDREGQEQGHDR